MIEIPGQRHQREIGRIGLLRQLGHHRFPIGLRCDIRPDFIQIDSQRLASRLPVRPLVSEQLGQILPQIAHRQPEFPCRGFGDFRPVQQFP